MRRGSACSRVISEGGERRRVRDEMEVSTEGGIGKVVERKDLSDVSRFSTEG